MWHGLPAREITAKMAVPPIKQPRLNTYFGFMVIVRDIITPKRYLKKARFFPIQGEC